MFDKDHSQCMSVSQIYLIKELTEGTRSSFEGKFLKPHGGAICRF